MAPRYSMRILRLAGCLLALLWMGGCASVQSTAQFYIPSTTKTYPPKPKDAEIPILGKPPTEAYTEIGRLVFESDLGWKFMRKSMEYNAQVHGADAVILKNARVREQMSYINVPPRTDWVPYSTYYRGRNGQIHGGTSFVPVFQPGYVQPWLDRITGIDAQMIVFKK